MKEKSFKVSLLTPRMRVFQGDAIRLQAPSTEGYFEVLYNHTLFLTALKVGRVRVTTEMGTEVYAISGGFAEVYHNQVSILAETAEPSNAIDVERAQAAKERAINRLRERTQDTDIPRAKMALLRALNRISTAHMGKK